MAKTVRDPRGVAAFRAMLLTVRYKYWMGRRYWKSASRLSVLAWSLGTAALSMRVFVGCGDAAGSSSTFEGIGNDGGDAASSVFVPPLSDGAPSGPAPDPAPTLTKAGPPLVAPTCNPSVARESCTPPESTYPLPSTIVVAGDGDAGCRQSIHAETRDGGAFACVIGSATQCYGPLAVGTKYPFTLGHSSAGGGTVTATFEVRFDGDGGVPTTVALSGCFASP
jgi:hypothetical protein